MSRSSSGLTQVSNLAGIKIRCEIPARTLSLEPGQTSHGLTVATVVYKVSADGGKERVTSEVNVIGAAHFVPERESVDFLVHLPLDATELEAEARRYFAKIQASTPQEQLSEEARRHAIERLEKLVYQDRAGRFDVECRVLDGQQVVGVGTVQLEVLFKGRFSDVGLPGAPTA